ncbi:MAG: type IV secretion protein IcmC [Gammaproteobacteria bacterium]
MIINLADSMPDILAMVTGAAYIIGMMSIIRGVYQLKIYGDLRTMMSSQTSFFPPLVMLVTGGLLLYFPSALEIGLTTVFGYDSPLTYNTSGTNEDQIIGALVIILQVIGVISFIRGLMMLQKIGQQGGGQGVVGRGLLHIVGGLLAINIYGFWQILSYTLIG